MMLAVAIAAACGTDSSPSATPSVTATPTNTVVVAQQTPLEPTPHEPSPTEPSPTQAPPARSTNPEPTEHPTASATEPANLPTPEEIAATPTATQPAPTPTVTPEPITPDPVPTVTLEPTATTEAPSRSGPTTLTYQVLATHPHDPEAFTQGLLWSNGQVFESTGLRGQSVLRTVDLPTGEVVRETSALPQHFGEGLALVNDQLVWLTWQSETAGVYDRDTLEQTGSFTYAGEGWGLCHDGTRLVMSNGSNTLTFRHPETFEVLGSVRVYDVDGSPVNRLNELECVDDDVWANVWLTDRIVVIDPATGAVVAEADMGGIISPHPTGTDGNNVLNGIAYRPDTATFLITGKRWPTLFEVRFEPLP